MERAKITDDKSRWPRGAWTLEPDEKHWTDESTGLSCSALRGPTGAWCGYVGVGKDHVTHGLSYYQSEFTIDEILDGSAAKAAPVQKAVNDLRVHGGLTYSGSEIRGEPLGLHWFGFDCAHSGDFSPKYDSIDRLGADTGFGGVNEYRDLAYVMDQCAKLAAQIAAIEPSAPSEQHP